MGNKSVLVMEEDKQHLPFIARIKNRTTLFIRIPLKTDAHLRKNPGNLI